MLTETLIYQFVKQQQSTEFFKGMVHLIYKLYLKDVFLCVKFNGAIGFSEKRLFLT